ncbi:ABC transporter ATP-binding protein (plasmid) [Photobacterium sp. GJ3]|uniref:ABC transporter ATP-binding protein n=1 Tax=Photobacterium sp. GJ3 TaxID=2829502 RepID=UPI001B8B2911|nr:ABC transporter ATP-binding protein [Photobacterium sp. GJ3]QUJ69806.1 ABC transporter ATP-binding protein [Photobacterium sp. GJ3]
MAEIRLESLAHSYTATPTGDDDYAIRRMNHVWTDGGAFALLGPSGCGKSTMLNIISGLLSPSEGQVKFNGKTVNQLPPQDRNIAQVFQFPVIYDTMTVFDNLAFPLRNMKTPEALIRIKVHEIADILELTPVLDRKARNLNADEKQKVSMGRGLVRDDVSAILFDEPLTVIDPHLKWKLRRKLKQIHEQFNITMVYVTHDQLEAATFADQIAVMYEGRIVQFGTPRELFERPNHTFVGYFIGSPGMNLLPVERDSDSLSLKFKGLSIPLSAHQREALHQSQSANLKLGIRPEFIQLWESERNLSYPVTITHTEDLGTYKIVTAMLADTPIKIRLAEGASVPESQGWVTFPAQWLKLYIDEYLIDDQAPGGTHAAKN